MRQTSAWIVITALGVLIAMPTAAQTNTNDDNEQPTLNELLEVGEKESESQEQQGEPNQSENQPNQPADQAVGNNAPDANNPDTPSATQPAPRSDPLTEILRDQLKEQQSKDPFASAVGQMETVAQRLSRDLDAGRHTQRIQQQIIKKLDQVLAKARQRRGKNGGGSSNKNNSGKKPKQNQGGKKPAGTKGGQKSGGAKAGATARAGGNRPSGSSGEDGSTNVSDAESMEALRRQWGSLPPRLRDELTEGLEEPFSPVYQSLTEAYYRRLAEQMQSGAR